MRPGRWLADCAPLWLRPASLAAALVLAASLAACGQSAAQDEHGHGGESAAREAHHDEHEELVLSPQEAERAGIRVERVAPRPWHDEIVVTATTRLDQERLVHIAPRVEGRITAAPARLGDTVRAGQVLAVLDSLAVGEAHAAWVQAQAAERIASADYQRARRLHADEIIARKDFLRAQSEHEKAVATLQAAAERLRLLGGSTHASDGQGSSFTVVAPFGGTVIEKNASLGKLASPDESLFTVADLGVIWIQADLPETALARVRLGARARVGVPAYPDERFEGSVDYIAAVVDSNKHTVAARIAVANTDGRLKPQMLATAAIETAGTERERIALPAEAIVLIEGQASVFVREGEHYEDRAIEPGERVGERTVIRSGLAPGEEVVVAGAYALKARKLKSQVGHGH